MAMSKDGRRLYVGGGKPGECGVVQQRDWPALDLKKTWTDHLDVVYAIAMSEYSQEWCSASWSGDCKVYTLDATANHAVVNDHSAPLFAATFVSNHHLATSGADRTIVVSNVRTGKSSLVLKQHTKSIHALAYQFPIRKGQAPLLASASEDRTVRFWHAEIGRLVRFHRFESIPRTIAWSKNGDQLIVGCDDGSVWQLNHVSLDATVLATQPFGVQNLLVDSNNDDIVLSGGDNLVVIKRSDRN